MDRFLTLATEIEKAPRGSSTFDLRIFRLLHPEYDAFVEGRGGLVHPYDSSDQRTLSWVTWSPYTSSLNAVVTLIFRIPESRWQLNVINKPGIMQLGTVNGYYGQAPTPAQALCAAFLRSYPRSYARICTQP